MKRNSKGQTQKSLCHRLQWDYHFKMHILFEERSLSYTYLKVEVGKRTQKISESAKKSANSHNRFIDTIVHKLLPIAWIAYSYKRDWH